MEPLICLEGGKKNKVEGGIGGRNEHLGGDVVFNLGEVSVPLVT